MVADVPAFADQVLFISGAGRGLGAALARSPSRGRVALKHRRSAAAWLGERAFAMQADVTDRAAADHMVRAVVVGLVRRAGDDLG